MHVNSTVNVNSYFKFSLQLPAVLTHGRAVSQRAGRVTSGLTSEPSDSDICMSHVQLLREMSREVRGSGEGQKTAKVSYVTDW